MIAHGRGKNRRFVFWVGKKFDDDLLLLLLLRGAKECFATTTITFEMHKRWWWGGWGDYNERKIARRVSKVFSLSL